jgi:serine/threonine protein phosphatase PrpC
VRDLLVSADSLDLIAERLIDRANSLGGPDNSTVIVIDVASGPEEASAPNGLIGAASTYRN